MGGIIATIIILGIAVVLIIVVATIFWGKYKSGEVMDRGGNIQSMEIMAPLEKKGGTALEPQDAVSRSRKDKKKGIIFLAISCLLLLTVYILAGPAGLGGILVGILGILMIAFLISGLFYLIKGLVKKS